jgi:hypothetical protein
MGAAHVQQVPSPLLHPIPTTGCVVQRLSRLQPYVLCTLRFRVHLGQTHAERNRGTCLCLASVLSEEVFEIYPNKSLQNLGAPSPPSIPQSEVYMQVNIRSPFYAPYLDSLNGYLSSSSFLNHTCFFFFVTTCSAQTCFTFSFMNLRMYRGSHSSLATPRSLQQRISAFDLHPSVAVGMPAGEK